MKLADILAFTTNTSKTLVIERPAEPRYQIRFAPDKDPALKQRVPKGIRVEGRRWVDQSDKHVTSTRGTVAGYVGWARWSTFLGFSVASVLADDWEFVKNPDGDTK